VSSGETKIANYDDYNISIDNTFVIIDNINIYGDDYASYGIILRSKRSTLHNMGIYNNVEFGIRISNSSENLLKNINIFDNDRGIY
jgi:parallel beta-helix repeat protein